MIEKSRRLREQHPTCPIVHVNGVCQKQMPLGSCDSHIEQAPLLFQFVISYEGIGGWESAVDRPNHKDTLPFQPFRRVDRRKNEPFIITIRRFHVHGTAVGGSSARSARNSLTP